MEAVQKNTTITETAIIEENGMVVGYLIRFSDGKEIRIMNGKNGKDGEDGESLTDVCVPQIGIKQDTDGNYYWTINGEWLLNEYGNKIQAVGNDGENGTDGKPGEDGSDGKDGISPIMKIKNDRWMISLDDGKTWSDAGPAKGEPGANGSNGNAFFKEVNISNPDFVKFVLSDGTEIMVPTWESFTKLQTLCQQMNENLSSLQTMIEALQERDFVESVTPLYEDSRVIGYTIVFSKKGSVVIYNGKDGQSAVSPTMPKIGVAKDADGIYYWTLDGEWILNEQGQKMKVEGEPGEDGTPGKDGVSPQMKIEEGFWMISYDGGKSWQKGDKAVGETGAQGEAAVPFFKEVRKDDKNMYVVLADGTELILPLASDYVFNKIKSLTYVPRYADGAAVMVKPEGEGLPSAEFDFLVSPAEAVADIEHNWKNQRSVCGF